MPLLAAVSVVALHLATTVANPHRGAVLPAARFVVVAVPVLALCFYLFVVRPRRDR